MAMFGGSIRKMFGGPSFPGTPGIGDEIGGYNPALDRPLTPANALAPQPQPQPQHVGEVGRAQPYGALPFGQPPASYGTPPLLPPPTPELDGPMTPDVSAMGMRKPGFLARNGAGVDLLGGLADGMLALNGMQPVYQPMQQHRRNLAIKERDYERERRDKLADWMAQQNYRQQHPDDQFTQYLTAAGINPRSQQGQALYRQRAEAMATPPTVAVDGFDAQGNPTKTFMPRTGFGGQSAPSGLAPGMVKNGYRYNGGNPNDRSSWAPVGGASSGGGATFR